MQYNNNKAYLSQTSWGRLEMKPTRPNTRIPTKVKEDGKEEGRKKREKKSNRLPRKDKKGKTKRNQNGTCGEVSVLHP
jgi:hypothetical protein